MLNTSSIITTLSQTTATIVVGALVSVGVCSSLRWKAISNWYTMYCFPAKPEHYTACIVLQLLMQLSDTDMGVATKKQMLGRGF